MKQFWALVRRAERKKWSLSAIKNEHGNLLINRELVERIVLQQLALIFSGQESPVFSHRNEQLLKEMNVKSIKNWKDWIIPENDEKMYEDEVCARVTVTWKRLNMDTTQHGNDSTRKRIKNMRNPFKNRFF